MILHQMAKFGLVGIAATGVHLAIGLVLIDAGWHPLVANIVAFITAFCISFVGHFGCSFADQRPDPRTAFRRFAFVAFGGFAVNETILSVLIFTKATGDPFALAVATLSAAAVTYLLSKHWAFSANPLT